MHVHKFLPGIEMKLAMNRLRAVALAIRCHVRLDPHGDPELHRTGPGISSLRYQLFHLQSRTTHC